jgi:hypothetical protein
MLLVNHIARIRDNVLWERSPIVVYVEHNLGFEAEHHERALRGVPGVSFYRDERRQRVGMLTTLQVPPHPPPFFPFFSKTFSSRLVFEFQFNISSQPWDHPT